MRKGREKTITRTPTTANDRDDDDQRRDRATGEGHHI
jgi:hypothetical protein